MTTAIRIGKVVIRSIDKLVDMFVIVIILLLVFIGIFAMWDSKQVYVGATAKQYEIYKPDLEEESVSFEELMRMNPDVFCWLTVYGTNIDYPVVQGTDNKKYINTNAEGNHSYSGAIFLDYRNSRDFSDFSSILYGHHMEKNTMFGEIGSFSDREYFDSHKYGSIYYNRQDHGLDLFALIHVDAYNDAVFRTTFYSETDKQEYLDMIYEEAIYFRYIDVTSSDSIVLLSTCSASSTNGRDILVAKITDQVKEDPFYMEKEKKKENMLFVDEFLDLWAKLPIGGKIITIVIPLILILIFILSITKKYKGKKTLKRKEIIYHEKQEKP